MIERQDNQPFTAPTPDRWERLRSIRIRVFIGALALLNLPFLLNGVLLLNQSPLVLILVVLIYAFLPLYYLLQRLGRGVEATYACLALLMAVITAVIYNSTSGVGFLLAGNVLYVVLVIAAAAVLASVRAVDVAAGLALLGYSLTIGAELVIDPVTTVSGQPVPRLQTIFVVAVNVYIGIIGAWFVLRDYIKTLRQLTGETEQARAQAELRAETNAELADQLRTSNSALLSAQQNLRETVEALSLPLIPLNEHVLLLPVVGYLDGERRRQLQSSLLTGIHLQRAHVVILDITGLRAIDAEIAAGLLQAVQAARLLGARVILSGVGAAAARTLVELDLDLTGFETTGSLSEALVAVAELPGTYASNHLNRLRSAVKVSQIEGANRWPFPNIL